MSTSGTGSEVTGAANLAVAAEVGVGSTCISMSSDVVGSHEISVDFVVDSAGKRYILHLLEFNNRKRTFGVCFLYSIPDNRFI